MSELQIKQATMIIVLSSLLVLACAPAQKAETVMEKPDPVERGKYLVTIMDCTRCHTPMVKSETGLIPDTTRLLAGSPENIPYPTWTSVDLEKRNALMHMSPGKAFAAPWGVSFPANLTPDDSTGIGEWTDETFIQAMRTGKHQGQPDGRDILPPMPWFAYKVATDEDLKAIWTYLRSIPAVVNMVPTPVPPDSTSAIEEQK